MKITKTQIDYLRKRLNDIRDEKLKEFSKSNPNTTDYLDYYDAIKAGKVKLKPRKVVEDSSCRNWHCTPDIKDLFDVSFVIKKFEEAENSYKNYRDKLDKAMTEIMDKVVLSDLMIEEAVAEFKKL